MDRRARAILWLDGGAAFAAGVAVLTLHGWLARLHAFPVRLVVVIGVVNLAYASYSGTLAALASRGRVLPRRAIDLLVTANLAWTGVCAALVAIHWQSATIYGLVHVGFEGVFVACLAVAERRWVRPAARG